MNRSSVPWIAAASLLLAVPARAGDVSVLLGPPGGPRNVQISSEVGAPNLRFPPELQGIVLLPIDFAGRNQAESLLPGRPRLREDVPGASRVLLPQGQGSLYRYRRDPLGGPSRFGFFRVDANGTAASVLERDGTGAGDVDPFGGRVAIDPAGTGILVATTVAAGGDLLEVDLVLGTAVDRTAAVAARAWIDGSLALMPTFGAATHATGVARFSRAGGAQAANLALPTNPTLFLPGFVSSPDGSRLAVAAGTDPLDVHVFAFDAAGAAVRVSQTGSQVLGPGHLPESLNGPYMALSSDGSMCAWKSLGVAGRNVFTGRVDIAGAGPQTEVTGDSLFVDTLDDAGVVTFVGPGTIIMLVGEQEPAGTIDGADFFQVSLDTNGNVVGQQNLSMTSGSNAVPFQAGGQLKSEGGIFLVPGYDGYVMFNDGSSGQGEIATVPWAGGMDVHYSDVRGMNDIRLVGNDLVYILRHDDGVVDQRVMLRQPADFSAPPTPILELPLTFAFRATQARSDGWLVSLVDVGAAGSLLMRMFVPTGQAQAPLKLPLGWSEPLCVTPLSSLGSFLTLPSGLRVGVLWPMAGPVQVVPNSLQPGIFLPGA